MECTCIRLVFLSKREGVVISSHVIQRSIATKNLNTTSKCIQILRFAQDDNEKAYAACGCLSK